MLTVTGKVSAVNQGPGVVLDPATLEQMGVARVRLYEPWEKRSVDFQGIWLEDLLGFAGTKPAASKVHMTALDDYQVDLTLAEIRAGGVFLATKDAQGGPIPVEKGGPTRIVFMDGVPAGANTDRWIWSLKTIDVR